MALIAQGNNKLTGGGQDFLSQVAQRAISEWLNFLAFSLIFGLICDEGHFI